MTGTERQALNERIALAVGWIKGTLPYETIWASPEDSSSGRRLKLWKTQDKLPDFTRKWEHAGPLLDLMCNGSGMTNDKALKLVADRLCVDPYMEVSEATAVAFDAWKKEKE